MNQVIGYNAAHDANITVYRTDKDQFFTLELERITAHKHFRPVDMSRVPPENFLQVEEEWVEDNIRIYNLVLDQFARYNIENNFSVMTWRSRGDVHNFGQSIFNFAASTDTNCYHHEAHTWSAYMQSPFDSAFVISWDGGGDGTCFQVSVIKDGQIKHTVRYPYEFGPLYIKLLSNTEIFKKTESLDIAGKAMGLSAYGEVRKEVFKTLDDLAKVNPNLNTVQYWQQYMSDRYDPESIRYYKNYCDDYDKLLINTILSEFEGSVKDCAATIQKYIEQSIITLIKRDFIDYIKQCDNNLIMTGGVALNVLVNQKIKDTFPDINVYVPPNPHDGGLSVGMVYKYLLDTKQIDPMTKYDLSNSGPELFDLDKLDTHLKNNKHRVITLNDLVTYLKAGKIIGFLQGRMEIGPRALGNRSILCDASYPDMKNIINSKVKFREDYRPFAPMCLKEDASKYFIARDFDNTEHMSYTVNVKDEHKQNLQSITHVDGTARLQTVTKTSNPVMHKLLKVFDGVLLNTSFNIQGQPILNTLKDASINLARTQLDGYVLYHNDKFYYFYK